MAVHLHKLAALMIGILVFVGLPLLGWGIFAWSAFFVNPVRLGYVAVAAILSAIVAFAFPNSGQSHGSGIKRVQRQHAAVVVLQIVSTAIVVLAPFCDRHQLVTITTWQGVRWVGLVLFSLGMLGMNWAAAALDRQFSTEVAIQPNHQLIIVGPYRYLRHPRYAAMVAFFAGIALVFNAGACLLLTMAAWLVLLWRIHDEEQLLSQQFGAAWQAYKDKTWRMVPFLY